MLKEIQIFNTNNLVLKVSDDYNPITLNLEEWDNYLNVLCGDRAYQKEAIKKSIIYLASGRYTSLKDLIEENFKSSNNMDLKERYKNKDEYIENIQIPGKLSANIDLATGTGKSYVMYGIAQIMLAIGLIDKVLVLCPSLTIECGLTEKFKLLSENELLRNSLPINSKIKNPRIINAEDTILNGDICIENIHVVYDGNNSSINDSLKQCGDKVIVLNDESHHIFNTIQNKENEYMKKWKEFLIDTEYNFKYVLGFTGTAYVGDEYFNDVIYRYSLRSAVDDKIIKMIEYVSKDDSTSDDERFQKILDNHLSNKLTYNLIKPITILITKDITTAKRVFTKFKEFLIENQNMSSKDADEKILIVTSNKEHKKNVDDLKYVDNKDNPVEWIISVSMLTEGWDVKNVFQIVPWHDRAFNSKLLIAQVLGRGLRIPNEYRSFQPKVKVFNHISFSKNIKRLVDEILEVERKLRSSIIKNGQRSQYNFSLYNIDYEKEQKVIESGKKTNFFDYSKGYINLIAQIQSADKETEYIDLKGKTQTKTTQIAYKVYSVEEVVNKIYSELENREWEAVTLKMPNGLYSKENLPPKSEVEAIIRRSMQRVGIEGEYLVDVNRQKILSMFATLLRKSDKTCIYTKKYENPYQIRTDSISDENCAIGNLKHDYYVFYTGEYDNELDEEQCELLEFIITDDSFPNSASYSINTNLFKTPVDILIVNKAPEREFVKGICKRANALLIDSWIKSRNQNFYSIEYSVTTEGGRHSSQHYFNPDFFIKLPSVIEDSTETIVVIEIKDDNDISNENKAKLKYARKHFQTLNSKLQENGILQKYIFHFLSPNSYAEFFEYLREGKLEKGEFRSFIEDCLE